jgi:hypothetical protein
MMEQMDVLLIAHAFPPDSAVGSIRAHKVASALRDRGHRVNVIAARLQGETAGPVEDAGLTIHRVRSFANPQRALSRAQAKFRRRESRPREAPSATRSTPSWKRHVLSLLWVPDDRQGFVGPAVACARRLIRSGVELVYTTAPPFSDHLVGLILKTLNNVRWVAEFRDPWSDNPLRPPERCSAEADALNRWLERRCLRAADQVVTVTENTMALLQAKTPEAQREKFILARNGIDRLASIHPTRPPAGPFRLVHAGSLYQDRDPRPFFRAVASLCARRQFGPRDIEIDFIGRCDTYGGQSLREFTAGLGIGPIVRFTDWIAHDECQAVMSEADLLVLFAQNNPNQVANKLYDYLGTRRPILAIGEADGESARMLRQIGGHYLVSDYDPASIEVTLEEALRGSPPAPTASGESLLEQWSTRRQLAHLMTSLGLNETVSDGSSSGRPVPARVSV